MVLIHLVMFNTKIVPSDTYISHKSKHTYNSPQRSQFSKTRNPNVTQEVAEWAILGPNRCQIDQRETSYLTKFSWKKMLPN